MGLGSVEVGALVVLGSRVKGGAPQGALLRRLEEARRVRALLGLDLVLFSGGKRWDGRTEAAVMAEWWTRAAGEVAETIQEQESLTTLENAIWSTRLLKERGIEDVALVTCDFHMHRAQLLFRREGLRVLPFPAHHRRPWRERVRLGLRELGALGLDLTRDQLP